MNPSENSILKIYASSTDQLGFDLLYEHLVVLAKEKGIAGVTVYRGIMGYGLSSTRISSSKFWELTEKLPVVIEMIDKTEVLEVFYKSVENELKSIPKGCLVTMHPIDIKLQKTGNNKQPE
jgi:PII-like signaling protein